MGRPSGLSHLAWGLSCLALMRLDSLLGISKRAAPTNYSSFLLLRHQCLSLGLPCIHGGSQQAPFEHAPHGCSCIGSCRWAAQEDLSRLSPVHQQCPHCQDSPMCLLARNLAVCFGGMMAASLDLKLEAAKNLAAMCWVQRHEWEG